MTQAQCAAHPEAGAVSTCSRCGVFVCGHCVRSQSGFDYCATCYVRAARFPASRRSKISLALTMLSMFAVPFVAGGTIYAVVQKSPLSMLITAQPVLLNLGAVWVALREKLRQRRVAPELQTDVYVSGALIIGICNFLLHLVSMATFGAFAAYLASKK